MGRGQVAARSSPAHLDPVLLTLAGAPFCAACCRNPQGRECCYACCTYHNSGPGHARRNTRNAHSFPARTPRTRTAIPPHVLDDQTSVAVFYGPLILRNPWCHPKSSISLSDSYDIDELSEYRGNDEVVQSEYKSPQGTDTMCSTRWIQMYDETMLCEMRVCVGMGWVSLSSLLVVSFGRWVV